MHRPGVVGDGDPSTATHGSIGAEAEAGQLQRLGHRGAGRHRFIRPGAADHRYALPCQQAGERTEPGPDLAHAAGGTRGQRREHHVARDPRRIAARCRNQGRPRCRPVRVGQPQPETRRRRPRQREGGGRIGGIGRRRAARRRRAAGHGAAGRGGVDHGAIADARREPGVRLAGQSPEHLDFVQLGHPSDRAAEQRRAPLVALAERRDPCQPEGRRARQRIGQQQPVAKAARTQHANRGPQPRGKAQHGPRMAGEQIPCPAAPRQRRLETGRLEGLQRRQRHADIADPVRQADQQLHRSEAQCRAAGSAWSSHSIQCRTGVSVPDCRWVRQPMLADRIMSGAGADRWPSLRSRNCTDRAGCSTE